MPALSALSMGSEPGLLPLALVLPLRRGEREKNPLQLVFFQVSAALSASVVQWPTCCLSDVLKTTWLLCHSPGTGTALFALGFSKSASPCGEGNSLLQSVMGVGWDSQGVSQP